MLCPKGWQLGAIIGIRACRAGGKHALFGVPDSDDEWCGGGGGGGGRDFKPESLADRKRGGFASVDEVPPGLEILDAAKPG